MSQRYAVLSDELADFIQRQRLFFVATAAPDGRINLSPKGLDSLRVLAPDRIVWLNLTGSGNETAAHVRECPRMTLMCAAFEGRPLILRIYGTARVVQGDDSAWRELSALFPPLPGARQIFDLAIELVQTSCGMAVPLFDYVRDRDELVGWAERKGDAGIRDYWQEKNQVSLDGKPTGIAKHNG